MKIEINKKYKTTNEWKVIVHTLSGPNEDYPVVISIQNPESLTWIAESVTTEGKYKIGCDSPLDLIEVKEKKQLTGFLNVYEDGIRGNNLWPSKEDADMTALSHHTNRIACIDLSQYGIFYEEGEGL